MLRNRLRSVSMSAALIAGALCLSPGAAPQVEADPFPTPQEGLVIRGGEEKMSLLQLVELFGEVTGENIILSVDTRVVLGTMGSGLLRDLEVAPKNVYSIVETVLIANRFVITDMGRGDDRMMSISSLDSAQRSNVRGGARFVPEEQLAYYATHPALLIQTSISLPHSDVRTMGNSLRALVVDPNTMQIVPIPESNGVILIGFAPQVIDLVKLLKQLDEDAARNHKHHEAADEEGE